MSKLDYCVLVQRAVLAARPAAGTPALVDWFRDSGLASRAVSLAIDGKGQRGVEIAEQLAISYLKD